jgi:ribosome-associated translation inhibitor RaiA
MQIDIKFRHLDHSAALETRAQELAAKLGQLYSRLNRCEVSIENTHGDAPTARFRVRIHLDVPGQDIQVSHDQANHDDAYVTLNAAFKVARRQLAEHIRLMRGDTKHSHLPELEEQVDELPADEPSEPAADATGR